MSGTLYIVGTPIGNLSDWSARAAQTFAEADFIAAEDTRVTIKLLNHLGIKKPLVSYYEHNLKERGETILRRIRAGETCALCSDAGMPAISDPGELIVTQALEEGICVVPIPGPSAVITALAVSGQPTGRFCFEGFLPMNRRQRKERLQETCGEQRTLVFYEAPHKLTTTLADLLNSYGDRSVTICRELTKLHEEIQKTTLAKALAQYNDVPPRGEFVLVVAGAPAPVRQAWTEARAVALAEELVADGQPASAACKQAAAESGIAKSVIYRALTAQKEE